MYLARWQRLRTSETTVTSNDHPSGGDPAGSSQKALTLKTPKDVRLKPNPHSGYVDWSRELDGVGFEVVLRDLGLELAVIQKIDSLGMNAYYTRCAKLAKI